jgi:hypothetical protein
MNPRLNRFIQVETTAASQALTNVKETEVKIISGLTPHYVNLNATATTSSIYLPSGAVLDIELTVSDVIHVRSDGSGSGGHFTVLF